MLLKWCWHSADYRYWQQKLGLGTSTITDAEVPCSKLVGEHAASLVFVMLGRKALLLN
ncbi:hypothetical protein DFR28_102251 [Arenicella xantha]|uniref:Uncharacterized protein n=1 Tax=Arenicella xantha TaxID=644221 RepID=A0A395JK91_9GAMM|nr:hypothetical protein DFR28_102251 [Arenicella xantha]